MSTNGTFLYPNVTSIPGQGKVPKTDQSKGKGASEEFQKIFDKTLNQPAQDQLKDIKAPLKFSAHASQRLQQRKISLDPNVMSRITNAIDKAEAKGVEDTLVLTEDAALIVNVKNRTVVTAMDKNTLDGNVFTNIDGAVIV